MSGSPKPPKASIDAIIGASAAGEGLRTPSPAHADAVDILAERLDLLVADFGRWTEYKAANVDYIKEYTLEVKWHRITRLWVVIVCGVLVVALAALLVTVLCNAKTIFGEMQSHALTAVVVGSIGGIVIIAIAALKGAFSTVKDRNDGLPMPDHMKELVDVGRNIFGKG